MSVSNLTGGDGPRGPAEEAADRFGDEIEELGYRGIVLMDKPDPDNPTQGQGNSVFFGYEDERDVLAILVAHVEALAASLGGDVRVVHIQDPGMN